MQNPEINYDQVVETVLEDIEIESPEAETAYNNLDWFEAVLRTSKIFEEYEERVDRDIMHMEFGGGAVFAHLIDIAGYEAFKYWRGSDDTDKYFSSNYQGIESAWREAYPESPISVANNSEWSREYEVKHSANIEMNGMSIHCDFARPRTGEGDYDFESSVEVAVGDTNLRVPSVEDMLASKLRSVRTKDQRDIMNLLYVAEEKGIEQWEIKNALGSRDGDYFSKLKRIVGEEASGVARTVEYSPSEDYIEGFGF